MGFRIARTGVGGGGGGSGFFTTSFASTENPLGSGWVHGGVVGLDWQNMRSTGGSPGACYGAGLSPTDYNDCVAHRTECDPASHYSEIVAHIAGGYSPPDNHEIEVHVGCTITAHSITTYELLWALNSTSGVLMRWNGAIGTFDQLATSGTVSPLADGDSLRLVFDATGANPRIRAYIRGDMGTAIIDHTDSSASKISSGQPGIGAFGRAGSTMASYGFKQFTASDV